MLKEPTRESQRKTMAKGVSPPPRIMPASRPLRHHVVTSFNADGYKLYGRAFIATFERYWDRAIGLTVYNEGVVVKCPSARVKTKPIENVGGLVEFKKSFGSNPLSRGKIKGERGGKSVSIYDYRFDAIKFSHKVFAATDACLFENVDRLYWLDGDIITHAEVSTQFLERLIPKEVCLSFLGRPKIYSECGFLGFNLNDPYIRMFAEAMQDIYTSGDVFKLQEWHDSFVWDHVRKEFEQKGMKTFNLSENIGHSHVFVNSILGAVMDHLKGNRKVEGRSRPTDLASKRSEPYWEMQRGK